MKALVMSAPGQAELLDRPEPQPGPGEELVRVAAASVCATDRKLLARGAEPPRIPGHELVGHLDDGTPVGVHPETGCGTCLDCHAGWQNRCEHRMALGLGRDGGLAELVAVPRDQLVALDGPLTAAHAFLEPLACCLQALRVSGTPTPEAALVVGAGPMGLLVTWALQAMGTRVAVCQRSTSGQRRAAELGAQVVVSPHVTAHELESSIGTRPGLAVVTPPGPEPLAWAMHRLAPGSVVHAFAGTPDGTYVDANLVHYRHLSLVGSTGSTRADYRDAVRLSQHSVDLARLPHLRCALGELPTALRQPAEVHKLVVTPNGDAALGLRTPGFSSDAAPGG